MVDGVYVIDVEVPGEYETDFRDHAHWATVTMEDL